MASRPPESFRAGTDQGKEEYPMKMGTTLLRELKEMKEKMDLEWKDLLAGSPEKSGEGFEWSEKLPTCAGMGRRSCLRIRKITTSGDSVKNAARSKGKRS